MLSLLFLRSKTVCFISLDKTSPKSNDCCNSCEALLALRPLRFYKLRTDFCGALLRVVFSCFLSTAFLLSFRVVPVSSILRFFFSDHLFLLLALLLFCKSYRYVGVSFSEKTLLF